MASAYKTAAMRAGAPGNIRELATDKVERPLQYIRGQLHTFRRGGGMNPTVEQLASYGAMALQRSMMELVGRHPPLGAPGKHGTRVELFHGLMEEACTGNDNGSH